MPTQVRVKVNRAGVRALLRSPEVTNDLQRRASRIAAQAGEGMAVNVSKGSQRSRAEVVTETFEAMRREASDRALSRAVDAGRG